MASLVAVFLLVSAYIDAAAAAITNEIPIEAGSSLSPLGQPNSWKSPSGRFAFGFYSERGGFSVGIWLESGDHASEKVIVWTANRDDPPASSNTILQLTIDGRLLLIPYKGANKNIAVTSDPASSASMLDNGNFKLYNKDSAVIWESFRYPTDTLLGGQELPREHQLHSSWSTNNHSTGRFRLSMQYDGNLCLYPNTMATGEDAYWNTGTFVDHEEYDLYLANYGALILSSKVTNKSIYHGLPQALNSTTTIYRATLDADGNFRLYSHAFELKGNSKTSVLWQASNNTCDLGSFCGFNSYCTMDTNHNPSCKCLPGHNFKDPNQWYNGCERNFSKGMCERGKENVSFYNMAILEQMFWQDISYYQAVMSKEGCKKSCLEDCDCEASFFLQMTRECRKYRLPLNHLRTDNESSNTAFFKVGTKSIKRNGVRISSPTMPPVVITSKKTSILILILCTGLVTYSCIALAVFGVFIFKLRLLKYKKLLEFGNLSLKEEVILRSYSYKELVKATDGFKVELGRGSFGSVYRGSLHKGKKLIAVKRLEKIVNEGEREFQAEMRVIGRIHHRNLVRLFGYCAEGTKRLLVYEYMRNGSLADILFRAERRPNWSERVTIALDVARGILYLHEECEAPIIHCDIKPQNILMDDFWTGKISDFGLAKLLMPDQTRTFTGVRGTRGYLAPEWNKNTPISIKVDVYSYGIVLLEIVCCRRSIEVNVPRPEEIILSSWAYNCFTGGELDKLVGGDQEVDKRTLERMVKVALWCIQDEPPLRPSMKCVFLMLEGITDIAVPLCPTSASE